MELIEQLKRDVGKIINNRLVTIKPAGQDFITILIRDFLTFEEMMQITDIMLQKDYKIFGVLPLNKTMIKLLYMQIQKVS